MAYPGTVTTENQTILETFTREQMRASILKLVSAANEAKNTFETYWAQINDIISGLANDDIIPDGTGLAGAESLTKAKLVALMAEISQMGDPDTANSMNTTARRLKYIEAIGGTNMDG